MLVRSRKVRGIPTDRLVELAGKWPWLQLRYSTQGLISPATPASTWQRLTQGIVQIIRSTLGRDDRCLAYVLVPEVSKKGLNLAVYIAPIWFAVKEEPLVQAFERLNPEDQEDLLAAFYRSSDLVIRDKHLASMDAQWCRVLRPKAKQRPDTRLVRQVEPVVPLGQTVARYNQVVRKWAAQRVQGLVLDIQPNRIIARFADHKYKSAETFEGLGRALDGKLAPRVPQAFGYFAQRNKDFSFIARQTIDQEADIEELRSQASRACRRLCGQVSLDPDDLHALTITDLLGNAAKKHPPGKHC